MVHKSVLKVDVSCEKCKQEVFGIVSKLEGVNKIEADEEKGTIAVIGTADPYDIIMRLRKAGKSTSFVSVGPPPKPEEKKDGPKDCPKICPYPYPYPYSYPCPSPYPCGCWACRPMPIMTCQEPAPPCNIM